MHGVRHTNRRCSTIARTGTRSVLIIGSIDEDTGGTGPKPVAPANGPPNGPPNEPNVAGVGAAIGNSCMTSRIPVTRYTSTAVSSLVNSIVPVAREGADCDEGRRGVGLSVEGVADPPATGGGGGASLGATGARVEGSVGAALVVDVFQGGWSDCADALDAPM
jgi:hypothetical protein